MEPITATNRTIRHNGHIVTVNGNGLYTVTENGVQIGEIVFSNGHDGLKGFSNSFGVDCYMGIGAWANKIPICYSLRSAVCHALS